MIEFNRAENKMVLKLVYYGPALSGKTTNLVSTMPTITGEKLVMRVLDKTFCGEKRSGAPERAPTPKLQERRTP